MKAAEKEIQFDFHRAERGTQLKLTVALVKGVRFKLLDVNHCRSVMGYVVDSAHQCCWSPS